MIIHQPGHAFESLEMITGDNEQYSCEETSQLPVSQPGTDSLSAIDSKSIDKPSFQQMSAVTNPSITERSPAVTKVSISSPKALSITTSHSSNVSGVITTPNSTCGSGVNSGCTNSSGKVSLFVKISAGASLPEEENLVKGTLGGRQHVRLVDQLDITGILQP